MKHARLVNWAVPIWLLCFWGLANATPFTSDFIGYDWVSLSVAGAAGFMGGVLRTILTLASNSRAVLDILKEARKDLVVALVAGLVVYVVIEGMRSFYDMPRDLRMLVICGAGWARMSFFGRLDRFTTTALNTVDQKLGRKDAQSSAVVPLEEPK